MALRGVMISRALYCCSSSRFLDGVFLELAQVPFGRLRLDDELELLGRMAAGAMSAQARCTRESAAAERSMTKTKGALIRGEDQSAGATSSASRSAFSSARFLGTTSPIITCT